MVIATGNRKAALEGKIVLTLAAVCAMAVSGFYDLGHFDHNDFQYGVTPVLLARYRLYQDFSFDQTPLQAWLGLVVLRLVGPAHLYLALRLISLLCVWLAAWIGICICRRGAAHKTLVSLLFLAVFVALPPLVLIGGEIGNYSVGLALSAAALWLLLARRDWSFAVGLLAGLAVSEKLSNVYGLAAFGMLYLGSSRQLARFGAGSIVGVAPILSYLARAPKVFWFENVTYHYLINLYRGVAFHLAIAPLAAVGLAILLAAAALWPERRQAEPWAIVILLVAAAIGLVTPGIMFPQYWAPPDFLLALLGCLVFTRRLSSRPRLMLAVAGVALVIAAARGVAMVDEALGEARAGTYGIAAVLGLQRRITQTIAPIDAAHPGCHGDLVSAFAMPAVGSPLGIAPISAEGPFMMRLDAVLAANAPRFRGYSDVGSALNPGSAIITGYDPGTPYEAAMRDYAGAHRFRTVALGRFNGSEITLALPPACGG